MRRSQRRLWYQSKAHMRLPISPSCGFLCIVYFTYISHSAPPLRMVPLEFRGEVNHHETWVMGLLCGEVRMILTLTVFEWSTRVTDGRTDSQTDERTIVYSALSIILSRAKKTAPVVSHLCGLKFLVVSILYYCLDNSSWLIACPHCRRKVRRSHKSETVSQKCDCRRISPFSAKVSLLCDSLTFLRQGGQGFMMTDWMYMIIVGGNSPLVHTITNLLGQILF